MAKVRIVILAAGRGTRMESDLPKALVPLAGKAMVKHLLETVERSLLDPRPVIVVGHKGEDVMRELGKSFEYAVQEDQLGTAHAVRAAKDKLKDADHVLVLYGDQPLVSAETLKKLVERHISSGAKITLTTVKLKDYLDWRSVFTTFGRILRKNGEITGVREYKDASAAEKEMGEVNAGHYVFEAKFLWDNLDKIGNQNSQKEYYLPTLLEIAERSGEKIEGIEIAPEEALGANSREELEKLEKSAPFINN